MIGDYSIMDGYRVIETNILPLPPNHEANARRIVRHGMADILAWLGEEVGPEPNWNDVHMMIGGTNGDKTIFASPEMVATMRKINEHA